MEQMDDLPLDPSPQLPPPQDEPRPIWPWVVALLIVAGVAATIVYVRHRPAPVAPPKPVETQTAPVAAPPPQSDPQLGPSVNPIDLPALDASDFAVRVLIGQLSTRPELAAWLATDGLIRNLAVCIENVAEGRSPARHLRPLAPNQPFLARGAHERYTTEPRSFDRYAGLAATVAGMDMVAVARLYAQLKPRLDEAYRDLGHPPGEIDKAVEAAVVHLLETPAIRGDAPLTRVVLSYHYVEDNIEGLSGAQKQLLRMGPGHLQVVKSQLRLLAGELGIPATRLPAH
jgi:hypothetical protein